MEGFDRSRGTEVFCDDLGWLNSRVELHVLSFGPFSVTEVGRGTRSRLYALRSGLFGGFSLWSAVWCWRFEHKVAAALVQVQSGAGTGVCCNQDLNVGLRVVERPGDLAGSCQSGLLSSISRS